MEGEEEDWGSQGQEEEEELGNGHRNIQDLDLEEGARPQDGSAAERVGPRRRRKGSKGGTLEPRRWQLQRKGRPSCVWWPSCLRPKCSCPLR